MKGIKILFAFFAFLGAQSLVLGEVSLDRGNTSFQEGAVIPKEIVIIPNTERTSRPDRTANDFTGFAPYLPGGSGAEAFSVAFVSSSRVVLATESMASAVTPSVNAVEPSVNAVEEALQASNIAKGDFGESVVSTFHGFLESDLGGGWVEVNARVGRQGLDHLFLRPDGRNGIPKIMVGETKFNSSQLSTTKDGNLQAGPKWNAKRFNALANRYFDVASSERLTIAKLPSGDVKYELPLWIKGENGLKQVTIWKPNSKAPWNVSGCTSEELPKVLDQARKYGELFKAVSLGDVIVRSRIFHVELTANELRVTSYDAANVEAVGGDYTNLPKVGDFTIKFDKNGNFARGTTKAIQEARGCSYKEAERTREKLRKNLNNLRAEGKTEGDFSGYDVVEKNWLSRNAKVLVPVAAGAFAAGFDFVFQLVFTRHVDPRTVLLSGGSAFLSAIIAENIASKLGSAVAGAAIFSVVYAVGAYMMDIMDLEQAGLMAVSGTISGTIGLAVGGKLGACLGSVIGPWGTGIGFFVGAVVGVGVDFGIRNTWGRIKTVWYTNPGNKEAIDAYISGLKDAGYWDAYWEKLESTRKRAQEASFIDGSGLYGF